MQVAAGTDPRGIGQWLNNLPLGAKVGDWFFCHAGNTHGLTIEQLNSQIEAGVDKDGFSTAIIAEPNSMLEARMHPVPWWISEEASAREQKVPSLGTLPTVLKALGVKHLVVGHQPGKVTFAHHVERAKDAPYAFDGMLFLIDTGLSRGVDDGAGAVLHVTTGGGTKGHVLVETIDAQGKGSALWAGER